MTASRQSPFSPFSWFSNFFGFVGDANKGPVPPSSREKKPKKPPAPPRRPPRPPAPPRGTVLTPIDVLRLLIPRAVPVVALFRPTAVADATLTSAAHQALLATMPATVPQEPELQPMPARVVPGAPRPGVIANPMEFVVTAPRRPVALPLQLNPLLAPVVSPRLSVTTALMQPVPLRVAPTRVPVRVPVAPPRTFTAPFGFPLGLQPQPGRQIPVLTRELPLTRLDPPVIPFDLLSPFEQLQPPRRRSDTKNCPPCEKEKKKRKKREPREICYVGTYRETATGLTKKRQRKIPCQLFK